MEFSQFAQTFTEDSMLHHAYLVEGEGDAVLPELLAFLEKRLRIGVHGNPDCIVERHGVFTIEESRRLREQAAAGSVGAGPRVFIIAFAFSTREAQNALLKLLEEPNTGTHFFLIVPSADAMLPTVRSRMLLLKAASSAMSPIPPREFLSSPAPRRLELVKAVIEAKDKRAAIAFINALEATLYRDTDGTKRSREIREAFEALAKARGYLYDRSPSVKMLLEHAALTLPVTPLK